MSNKVTAQEAADHFMELLERVQKNHETFVILVNGEEIGQLSPVPAAQPGSTLGSFFELLKNNPPDAGFADDLEEIQASQPAATLASFFELLKNNQRQGPCATSLPSAGGCAWSLVEVLVDVGGVELVLGRVDGSIAVAVLAMPTGRRVVVSERTYRDGLHVIIDPTREEIETAGSGDLRSLWNSDRAVSLASVVAKRESLV
jgi:antitoxin (DNA-binding transcriptional repressor) of toxin-antitoxin stability system